MPARRVNPHLVKRNRTYTVSELAVRLGVHKNTVRNWQRAGLSPIDGGRPALFKGEAVSIFLSQSRANRKRPCLPGTFYCFRCREPRSPALGMVECADTKRGTANLLAICATCGTMTYRRIRVSALAAAMPGIDVQMSDGPTRLVRSPGPSPNSDSGSR